MPIEIPDRISVRIDPELREQLKRYAEHVQIEKISAVIRTALAAGARDALTIDSAILRAATREGMQLGLQQMKTRLNEALNKVDSDLKGFLE